MIALRRKWLPNSTDTPTALGDALWLDEHHREAMEAAVAKGINTAFNGK